MTASGGQRLRVPRGDAQPRADARPGRGSDTRAYKPTPAGLGTTRRRPLADKAASASSVFTRPSRLRCSATTTRTRGSASSRRTLERAPFIPDPTSASTPATGRQDWPDWAAHGACWSRPTFSSCDDTRAQAELAAVAGVGGIRSDQHATGVHPHRRHREGPLAEPSVRGLPGPS